MPFFGFLTGAAKQAFSYIQSGVEKGLSALETIEAVIKSGLGISEEGGVVIYETLSGFGNVWAKISEMPNTYKVGENFGMSSPFDFRQKHVMQMKIEYTDLATGEKGETWITVENDTALSKQEWLNLGDNAVANSPMGYQWSIDYVDEFKYYIRIDVESTYPSEMITG
jgi:hypothetical protein